MRLFELPRSCGFDCAMLLASHFRSCRSMPPPRQASPRLPFHAQPCQARPGRATPSHACRSMPSPARPRHALPVLACRSVPSPALPRPASPGRALPRHACRSVPSPAMRRRALPLLPCQAQPRLAQPCQALPDYVASSLRCPAVFAGALWCFLGLGLAPAATRELGSVGGDDRSAPTGRGFDSRRLQISSQRTLVAGDGRRCPLVSFRQGLASFHGVILRTIAVRSCSPVFEAVGSRRGTRPGSQRPGTCAASAGIRLMAASSVAFSRCT